MSKRNPLSFRPCVVQLESREVPAVATLHLASGVLTVRCNDTASTVVVSQDTGGVHIQDVLSNRFWNYGPGQVRRVDLFGGGGATTFTATGNVGVGMRLYAGSGNTTMRGAQGRTIMVGGSGNDTLYGRSGNDYIDGGAGNDYIRVTKGINTLIGGDGNDIIIGGTGTDLINGGNGDDTIVAINGKITSRIDPGNGNNVLWVDKNGAKTDTLIGITSTDIVHAVTAFANGASRVLNGGSSIANPIALTGDVYESFANRPLFSSAGPVASDITQQLNTLGTPYLDDGWLLAGLGSVVNSNPNLIKQNMVDFGDGTYGIQMGGFFVRVNNNIPVHQVGSVTPAYAGLGAENSMWVAIYEKAYAFFLTRANTYTSLTPTGNVGQAAQPNAVFSAFLFPTSTNLPLSNFASAAQLGTILQSLATSDFPIAVTVTTPAAGTALIANQAYSMVGFTVGTNGVLNAVILRNPYGIDGGGSTDSNPLDGLLTIDINSLFATTGTLSYATT